MDNTKILWTDKTLNIAEGCTKVSPGCDNCCAERINNRWGKNNWMGPLKIMAESTWRLPLAWQRKAVKEGTNPIVFCGSMCDYCDKNIPDTERKKLFKLIPNTPDLTWLLLTKRAPNIKKYLPANWGNGYDNVWLGVSVENKKHGLPRIDILRQVPAKLRFLSCEPLLEDLGELDLTGISWVIVGGESGAKSKRRPMKKEWVYNIKKQCDAQGVTFFFKQWNGDKNNPHDHLLDGKLYQNWPDGYISPTMRLPIMNFQVKYDDSLGMEGQLSQLFKKHPDKSKTIKGIFRKSDRKLLQQQLAIMNQFSRSEVLKVLDKF